MSNNFIYLASIFKSYYIQSSILTRGSVGVGRSPKEYLALGKKNILELMDMSNYSLDSVLELDFFGTITNLVNIPLSSKQTSDFIFIYTSSDNYVIGSIIEGVFIKKYQGNFQNLSQTKLRDSEGQETAYIFSRVTEGNIVIGVVPYIGDLRVISIKIKIDDIIVQYNNVYRLNVENLLDIHWLYCNTQNLMQTNKYPTSLVLGVLAEDKTQVEFKPYVVHLDNQEIEQRDREWLITFNKTYDHPLKFISLSDSSIYLISKSNIRLYGLRQSKCLDIKQIEQSYNLQVFEQIPGTGDQVLVSDSDTGDIYYMKLSTNNMNFQLMKLGTASAGSCMSYLGNSKLFLGSRKGDSQLIHILLEKKELIIEREFPNLSVITDTKAIKNINREQNFLVTCNPERNGKTLNKIQKGVQLDIVCEMSFRDLLRIWTIQFPGDQYTSFLCLGYSNGSRLLTFNNENQIISTNFTCFNQNCKTIYFGLLSTDYIVQVSEKCINLIKRYTNTNTNNTQLESIQLFQLQEPNINFMCIETYENSLYASTSDKKIIRFQLEQDQQQLGIKAISEHHYEVSCFACVDQFLVAGFWNSNSIFILNRETLGEITLIYLKKVGIRSCTIMKQSNMYYIVSGMNDGQIQMSICTYSMENLLIEDQKSYVSGNYPLHLKKYICQNNTEYTIVCSDIPASIHIDEQNLMPKLNDINSEPIYDICQIKLKNNNFQGILTLHKNKLCVNTFNLTKTSIVVSTLDIKTNSPIESCIYFEDQKCILTVEGQYINIYEENSGELTSQQNLKNQEIPQTFEKLKIIENSHLFVLGTLISKDNTSPNGRILLGYVKECKINWLKITEYSTPVLYLKYIKEDTLLCCIGSHLKILQIFNKGQHSVKNLLEDLEIKVIATKDINTTVHSMDISTDNVNYFACADPLKHLRIYEYDTDAAKIVQIAKSYAKGFSATIALLNQERCLESDLDGNLLLMRRPKLVDSEHERFKLELVSGVCINDIVTCMIKEKKKFNTGSGDEGLPLLKNEIEYVLMSSVSGTLYLAVFINEKCYKFLKDLQDVMIEDMETLQGLSYKNWRKIKFPQETLESKNVVEGDILKKFLQLPNKKIEEYLNKMSHVKKISISELHLLIDTLNRLI